MVERALIGQKLPPRVRVMIDQPLTADAICQGQQGLIINLDVPLDILSDQNAYIVD